MSITLVMLKDEREKALKQAHEAFIEEPTEEHAWQLAAAAENLLDVLEEM